MSALPFAPAWTWDELVRNLNRRDCDTKTTAKGTKFLERRGHGFFPLPDYQPDELMEWDVVRSLVGALGFDPKEFGLP